VSNDLEATKEDREKDNYLTLSPKKNV
jgi:hypothetical protein